MCDAHGDCCVFCRNLLYINGRKEHICKRGDDMKGNRARAAFMTAFAVLLGGLIGAYLSLLAIPYIPIKSYAGKTLVILIIFSVLSFTVLWESARFACYDPVGRKFYVCCQKWGVVALLAVIAVFIILRCTCPEMYAFLYNRHSFYTHSMIMDGDDTCLSAQEALDYSDAPRYLRAAGDTFYAAGKYNKAITFYLGALDGNNADAKLNYLLGRAYLSG